MSTTHVPPSTGFRCIQIFPHAGISNFIDFANIGQQWEVFLGNTTITPILSSGVIPTHIVLNSENKIACIDIKNVCKFSKQKKRCFHA